MLQQVLLFEPSIFTLDTVKLVGAGSDLEFVDFPGDDKTRSMAKHDVEHKSSLRTSCF